MTLKRRDFLSLAGGVAVSAALVPGAVLAADGVVSVVATTGMIADTTRRVGGDLVAVRALMGPGVDPHSYRQTRTDIVAMANADLVLWNGLYLEAQLEDVLGDMTARTTVRAVAEAVAEDQRVSHDDYNDRFDPHVWMDPNLWRDVIAATRDALIEVAPQHKAAFAANAEQFMSEVADLAVYSKDVLASVPDSARVLVTAHDAFNYFGRAYGFDVVGVQGISTESEAGLNRISELVGMLVDRQVSAVFVESSVSDQSIRALIEGAAAQGHDVRIGGELFSDAMGAPDTYEGTYIGMIDHNVTVIAGGLGGTVPQRGMNGQLTVGS